MMKSDTLEKNKDTISRQLEFSSDVYKDADDLLTAENNARGLISRSRKKFLKDFLPELLADGIKFRKGLIFTPPHLIGTFVRDDKWIKLKAKAELALEKLRAHEAKISEKNK